MNICGVLVHANPARLDGVVSALKLLSGVDVHDTADGGRVVVTIEDTEASSAIDTLADIHRLAGVVSASLVYHHFDSADEIGQSH